MIYKLRGQVTPEKAKHHARILSNRVRNRYRHFSKRFRKRGIDCFRLYDWDIPEVRAVVDWYAGHVVVAEYVRIQTDESYLPLLAHAVGETLGIPGDRVHFKRRQTKAKKGPRYGRMGSRGKRFEVRERDLRFWVNLDDYLDTGLYSDHRDTRVIVRDLAAGKDFLNLYAYTGAFTCAAASGGAGSTVSVDRSDTYLKWAEDNLALNGLSGRQHALIRSDVTSFLTRAYRERSRYTLAVVDPPSFFKDRNKRTSFDINRDHPDLIKSVLKVMVTGSTVFFSTNHQRFEPRLEELPAMDLTEITPRSIPEDYRNRLVHRCWRMTAP
ncbi:MAG: class I SAM-dependent methyltransferase [Candidatus Omnitrophota bacterium]